MAAELLTALDIALARTDHPISEPLLWVEAYRVIIARQDVTDEELLAALGHLVLRP